MHRLPKPTRRVRFPSPAPALFVLQSTQAACVGWLRPRNFSSSILTLTRNGAFCAYRASAGVSVVGGSGGGMLAGNGRQKKLESRGGAATELRYNFYLPSTLHCHVSLIA